MLLLSLILTCLVQARGPLKVIVHMGLGTNSHIKPLLEIGSILRERNHSVVYASFDSYEKFNKPYQLPFVSLGNGADAVWNQRKAMKEQLSKRETVDPSRDMPRSFGRIMPAMYDLTYPAIMGVIEQEQPDVVMCDFISAACRDAAQMAGVPLITGFQATDFFEITNSPLITTGLAYGSITINDLDFFQRFQRKVIDPFVEKLRYHPIIRSSNCIRAKYGVPPSPHTYGDFSSSLGLSSSFVGFEAPILFPPHIKMVGPIKSKSHPPLTPDLEQFLENHPKTLYIAFGSLVILADFDIENIVVGCLRALAEGSIDGVIWGLGSTIKEDFPEIIHFNGLDITRDQLFSTAFPSIQLFSWAPQTAILEHKNTKLFLSHGGLESSFEAILSGTPILCMPFLGDQPRNARKLEDAGIAKYIDRAKVTPAKIACLIQCVAGDTTGAYMANVERMRTIAQIGSRRKESGADAVEEYAYTAQICRPHRPYKYGEIPCELQHLTPVSRDMSYIKANLLDVYFVAFIFTFAAVYISAYLSCWLIQYLCKPIISTARKDQ